MKTFYVVYVIFLFVFFASCNKTKKSYFDTGELMSIEEQLTDSTYIVKEYYKNGLMKELTTYNDSFAHGYGESYYEDGELKWKGYYENGYAVCPDINDCGAIKSKQYIEVESKKDVHIGDTCKFRIIITDFSETCYILNPTRNVIIKKNNKNYDMYPYLCIPCDTGDVSIAIEFVDGREKIIIGKKEMDFYMFHVDE